MDDEKLAKDFLELKCLYKTLANALDFCIDDTGHSVHLIFLSEIISAKFETLSSYIENL